MKEKLISLCFKELVQQIAKHMKKSVVLLIDEYNKPLLDTLPNYEIRTQLRNFYAPIKNLDPYLKFVFITGVS